MSVVKVAAALGRRSIMRGALGLGAAVGLGAARAAGGAARHPMGGYPVGEAGPLRQPEPDWLKALSRQTDEQVDRLHHTLQFDGLDLDLAMIRSPSPAFKLVTQRRRNEARRKAAQTLWDRLSEAREKWMRGMLS